MHANLAWRCPIIADNPLWTSPPIRVAGKSLIKRFAATPADPLMLPPITNYQSLLVNGESGVRESLCTGWDFQLYSSGMWPVMLVINSVGGQVCVQKELV